MLRYDRTVVGYHGCDLEVARRLLTGEAFQRSENDYDWLGHGIYFWEYGEDRALRFAQEQERRGKLNQPAVVGALIQLGDCLDLMDTRFTHDLRDFFPFFVSMLQGSGTELPKNTGRTPDRALRRLDCAVLNTYLEFAEQEGRHYQTVRCGFVEGGPAYEGAGIHLESHIQLSVRDPRCIVGVFRPMKVED